MNKPVIPSFYLPSNQTILRQSINESVNDTLIRREITDFIRQVNYYLTIAEIFMVICGVVGNSLALIIINRRSLRDTSSSVFITYLAIFDSSVLLAHITNLLFLRWVDSYILHCFLAYLTDLVTFISVWIMVIMTIERCIAVHSPFLAKTFCTIQRARYSIYVLILFALIFFSSTFPIVHTLDRRQHKCIVRKQYQTLIRIVKPIMFYIIPDIILLINLFIIYELFMARRQRSQTLINPENAIHQINAALFNRKQQQLTIMLVTVSLSFYLFTTPAIIDYVRQRHPPQYRDVKRLKMRFLRTNLTVIWAQMNSATNFIFYCLSGSKFRATCLETFFEIYDYLRSKLDASYQRRRSSNFTMEMRNGLQCNLRDKRRSTSIQQTCTYQFTSTSKRPSNETLVNSQANSRRTSRCVLNIQEI